MTAAPTNCPACGSPASGKFCSACGASLVPRSCAGCRAELSPQARFCHRCGRPVGAAGGAALPARERTAWLVAGGLCVVLLALIVFKVIREARPAAAPEMANAGAQSAREAPADGGAGGPAGGTPPDISQMSPRERFDRLFNRVMQAGERGDTAQVVRFTPMALAAYGQLDSIDADARYHAAVLRTQVGDMAGALALADTILARDPGHLFGYVIRGTVAGLQNDTPRRQQALRDFRAHFAAESAAGRVEYQEHQPVIDEFKQAADSVSRTP
ncbi:MAG TPA: zinc ribbon domain-containing protein [Gemmatimonadales bacterium]|nr:zinc ribbon domain-containing protein [Gemmatimonadales bacterium]